MLIMHGVMVNWDPPTPAGWRQVPGSDHDPTMARNMSRPSICYIYSGIKCGEEWLYLVKALLVHSTTVALLY